MGKKAGFENALISKGLCIATSCASLLVILNAPKKTVDLNRVLKNGEFWSMVPSMIAFSSTGELIVGVMLLYTFRIFERHMGSPKYGAFLAIVGIAGKAMEIGAISILQGKLRPQPGPYSAIYAAFVLYYATIPSSRGSSGSSAKNSRGLALLSDKTMTYLLGAQLFWGSGISSIIPAMSGVLMGLAYRTGMCRLDKLKLPSYLLKAFKTLKPFVESTSARPAQPQRQTRGNNVHMGGPVGQAGVRSAQEQLIGGGMLFGPRSPQQPLRQRQVQSQAIGLEPPSDESIATLMALGFDREHVMRALQASSNNVDIAANRLLAGGL